MMIVYGIYLVLVAGCIQTSVAWHTNYKKDFKFECQSHHHLSGLKSEYGGYWNGYDRRWEYSCTQGFVGEKCEWSEYQTQDIAGDTTLFCDGWPQDVMSLVTGIKSKYNNGKRTWSYKCCKRNTRPGTDCKEEPFLNGLDGPMNKVLQLDRAIIGVHFIRERGQSSSDRRWLITTCLYTGCTVERLDILDRIQGTSLGTQIVGVVSSIHCSDSTATVSLSRTDTVTETMGLSIADATEKRWDKAVSVGAESKVGFLGYSAHVSFNVEMSRGGSTTIEKTRSKETNTGSANQAAYSLPYPGPGAAIIFGTVRRYRLDTKDVNVEVIASCDDGTEWKEQKKMDLAGTTYGKTTFESKQAKFHSKEHCASVQSTTCIHQIRGEHALESSHIYRDFDKCVGDKGVITK